MTTEPKQSQEIVSLWSYDVPSHTPSNVLSMHEELNNLYFRIKDKEPLVLTKDGFIYIYTKPLDPRSPALRSGCICHCNYSRKNKITLSNLSHGR